MSNFEQLPPETPPTGESLDHVARLVADWLGPEAIEVMRSTEPATEDELAARRRAAERLFPGQVHP